MRTVNQILDELETIAVSHAFMRPLASSTWKTKGVEQHCSPMHPKLGQWFVWNT